MVTGGRDIFSRYNLIIMLITILTIIALCINSGIIFLKVGDENLIFRRHLSIILMLGIFQLLLLHLCTIFFPQWLYLLLAFPTGLLFGPSLLLLVRNLASESVYKRFWIHLIPFMTMLFLFVLLFAESSLRYRFALDYSLLLHFCSVVQIVAYIAWLLPILAPLYATQLKRKNELLISPFFLLLAIMIVMIINLARYQGDLDTHRAFTLMLYLFFLFNISALLSVSRNRISQEKTAEKNHSSSEKLSVDSMDKKYTIPRASLSAECTLEYRNKVNQFIQTRGFLNTDLNREKLCKMLDIPSNHLSIFLKEEFGKNFNGFVNQLRLSYAAKQLKLQDLTYNMEDLSFICGFNSRASFYRNFLEEFGCSPLQYRLDHSSMS